MANPQPTYYTADMVRELIREDRPAPRYETAHGVLVVTPAPVPPHQRVVGNLCVALRAFLDREPIGEAFCSPADISWRRDDVLVQPDVFVITAEASARIAPRVGWEVVDHLLLAAEVLSPSSVRHDRFTKRRLYQEQQVPPYWVIDADARAVEVWTPDLHFPHVEHERLTWHPAGAREPFTLTVDSLFGSR